MTALTDKEKLVQLLDEIGVKYIEKKTATMSFIYIEQERPIEIDENLTIYIWPNFGFNSNGKFVEFSEIE